MKDYPQLSQMGILHPEQIEKFSVNSISGFDVLRVVYARRKGSLLPTIRTYKYPRVQKSVTTGGSTGHATTAMETDPSLKAALAELRALLQARGQAQDAKETILEELEALQEEVACRLDRLKQMVQEE